MKAPCEIAVWSILPQIRAELAKELVNLGLSQKETAKKLRLTPAAVSQYISQKRGKRIEFPEDLNGKVSRLASDIRDNSMENRELAKGMCTLCKEVRKTETFRNMQRESCGFCL